MKKFLLLLALLPALTGWSKIPFRIPTVGDISQITFLIRMRLTLLVVYRLSGLRAG